MASSSRARASAIDPRRTHAERLVDGVLRTECDSRSWVCDALPGNGYVRGHGLANRCGTPIPAASLVDAEVLRATLFGRGTPADRWPFGDHGGVLDLPGRGVDKLATAAHGDRGLPHYSPIFSPPAMVSIARRVLGSISNWSPTVRPSK